MVSDSSRRMSAYSTLETLIESGGVEAKEWIKLMKKSFQNLSDDDSDLSEFCCLNLID